MFMEGMKLDEERISLTRSNTMEAKKELVVYKAHDPFSQLG